MKEEIITANAEAVSQSVENQSTSDFVQRRTKKSKEKPPETSKESAEDSTEATEANVEVVEEMSEDNVLSQFNLDEMSEEEISVLRGKLIPGAESRIGELTAKRKAAEEQLASVQHDQNQLKIKQPEVKNNPFSEIATIEDLQAKADEVVEVISWAEDLLFEADNYNANDEVTQVEGKPMTKQEVRKALLTARKSRDSYIPDQLKNLQFNQNALLMRKQLGNKAIEELNWLQDDKENELKTQFLNLMSDPRLQSLEQSAPDLYSQIPYFMSHAVNSIYGRKLIPSGKTGTGNIKLDPSSTATPSSAASEKTERPRSKSIREHQNRFKESGRKDDFITLRTLQITR